MVVPTTTARSSLIIGVEVAADGRRRRSRRATAFFLVPRPMTIAFPRVSFPCLTHNTVALLTVGTFGHFPFAIVAPSGATLTTQAPKRAVVRVAIVGFFWFVLRLQHSNETIEPRGCASVTTYPIVRHDRPFSSHRRPL